MSLFSDVFSSRRRETCISNPTVQASAGGLGRPRRKSLSAKYQSLFSTFSHDFKSAIDRDGSGGKPKTGKPIDSTPPPHVSNGETTLLEIMIPVTVIEPRMSPKPAEETEILEKPRLRRRPKTPIRRIGEIEGYSDQSTSQRSVDLAKEYQATCEIMRPNTASPPASPTSCRSLRKTIGQHDLRRISIDSDNGPSSVNLSDEETVVGSEGPSARPRRLRNDSKASFSSSGSSWSSNSTSSYYSAASENDDPRNNAFVAKKEASNWSHGTRSKPLSSAQSVECNIEMQICLDLLKQNLCSAMPPGNSPDSSFALPVWLMIESYEALKRQLQQQQLLEPNGLGSKKTCESTFQVLDHWLEALYSVYNLQLQGRYLKATGLNQASA